MPRASDEVEVELSRELDAPPKQTPTGRRVLKSLNPRTAYCRTAASAAHALAPVESYARTTIVLVPFKTGMPAATHVPVPTAVPESPASVCHVIFVIPPDPPNACPARVIVGEPVL